MKRLFFLTLFFLVVGCNKTTSPKESPTAMNGVNEANIYPHPQDFGKTHGPSYQQNPELCAKCHGADLAGGNAKVSCATCHASYPHQKGWAAPQNHGVQFLKADGAAKAQCASCHGDEKTAGKISCSSCHSAYPHSDEFIAGGHAEIARKGEGICLNCHDRVKIDHPDTGKSISCNNCHGAGFPHPKGWANPNSHGKFYVGLSAADRKSCGDCHGNGSGTGAKNACQNCHSAFPHGSDWIDNGAHAGPAKTVEGKCTSCHKGLNTNMPNYESCSSCHDGKYDVKIGWKTGQDNAGVHPPTTFKSASGKSPDPRKPSSQPVRSKKPKSNATH